MARVKFHNAAGQECQIFWPPGTLSEAVLNFHDCDCQCLECSEEKNMDDRIGNEDVVTRFALLNHEVNAKQLSKRQAGELLHKWAKNHMKDHPKATYQEAFSIVSRLSPELQRAYLGLELLAKE